VAGSDDDNDGFICGPGDRFCGVYPTIDQPVVIGLAEDEDVSSVDFAVQTDFGGLSSPSSPGKYRLLKPR
jgi:hypothetical protein